MLVCTYTALTATTITEIIKTVTADGEQMDRSISEPSGQEASDCKLTENDQSLNFHEPSERGHDGLLLQGEAWKGSYHGQPFIESWVMLSRRNRQHMNDGAKTRTIVSTPRSSQTDRFETMSQAGS